MNLQDAGIVGLGVMGRNLALNIEDKGFSVSAYDAWTEAVEKMRESAEKSIVCFTDIAQFVKSLSVPRKILLLVKAGDVVDRTIEALLPHLSKGDLLIDGGNSFYKDTETRAEALARKDIRYLGTGVSGGEEGALHGPAIMPGGDKEAYEMFAPVLTAIAAKAYGQPCCTYIGPSGTGHFVKMVHNGIEYADMQLICEAYSILKKFCGFSNEKIAQVFSQWNEGKLNSYLIEITAAVLRQKDPETGNDLVDMILDKAGQKGTGKWTSQVALDLGVPIPTITESVFARYLSDFKEEREEAAKVFPKPETEPNASADFVDAVENALYASKIFAYAQGFALLKYASDTNGWQLRYDEIAAIFRGGCIIRAQFLNKIMEAYRVNPALQNLILDPYFRDAVQLRQKDLRSVLQAAIGAGIPVPAFASALSYFDSYTSKTLPANLLQAQRDYFGAHTFERTDKSGSFHFNWQQE